MSNCLKKREAKMRAGLRKPDLDSVIKEIRMES